MVQAPAPERLIKGGLPTEAMVAFVLVAKYAWHLPLYRQAQMLLAQGIDIKRAVLAFWVGYAAANRSRRTDRWRACAGPAGQKREAWCTIQARVLVCRTSRQLLERHANRRAHIRFVIFPHR